MIHYKFSLASSKAGLQIIKPLTLLSSVLIVTFFSMVSAHENVVVIPLYGEDVVVPLELKPTAPIAPDNTNFNDYTINNFTIIDRNTNLEWQREDDDIVRTWGDAWDYCANLNVVGNDDWRLPNVTELQSIVDYVPIVAPLIYPGFSNTKLAFYWSATSRAFFTDGAWAVSFTSGFISHAPNANAYYVRCVR